MQPALWKIIPFPEPFNLPDMGGDRASASEVSSTNDKKPSHQKAKEESGGKGERGGSPKEEREKGGRKAGKGQKEDDRDVESGENETPGQEEMESSKWNKDKQKEKNGGCVAEKVSKNLPADGEEEEEEEEGEDVQRIDEDYVTVHVLKS